MDIATILVLAQLQAYTSRESDYIPNGWEIQDEIHKWWGLDAIKFIHNNGEVVCSIKGLDGIIDVIGSFVRRITGYSDEILSFCWNADTVIGHSGGGGVASWLCRKLGAVVITFNSGRTKYSQHTYGILQTNVYVRGDIWGDPLNGLYGLPLPGKQIELITLPGENTHSMTTIIRALRDMM